MPEQSLRENTDTRMSRLFFPENLSRDFSFYLEYLLPQDTLIRITKDVIGNYVFYRTEYKGEDNKGILPEYLDKDLEKMDEHLPFYIFSPSDENPISQ